MMLAAWLAGSICFAQERPAYPARPVRVIVPLAAGGNLDLVTRAIAQKMAENTGQPFIVENRPSASGLIAAQFVAKAPADGYTVLGIANTFAMAPNVVAAAGYNPIKDFTGVSLTARLPHVLVVNPSLPVRTVKDLIALARTRPNEFTYGSAGAGSNGHVAGVLFSRQAGIEMLHVPYKGAAPALIDVIGGQITLMFDPISTSVQHVKAGKLRALGVTTRTRSPLLPELPTIAEAALPGFEAMVFNALMAPAGLPRDVLLRLHDEVMQAAQSPEVRERFLRQGVEIVASDSAEQFADFLKSETARYARIAQDSGIKSE
jgi:tripartite-type tricarboxylate transporter receptor subunit TctC